jgi:hypothetical protein
MATSVFGSPRPIPEPPKPKPPMFMDLNGRTVRINPKRGDSPYITMTILSPPQRNEDGDINMPARYDEYRLTLEDAMNLGNLLLAQGALELVE